MLQPQPATLTGRLVELQPFVPAHAAGLFEAAQDDEVWTYIPWAKPQAVADMEAFVPDSRERMAAGTEMPFAIVELASGKPVGQISYIDIAVEHGHLEIGTWLSREVWRSGINTECKYLMLRHAFETAGCIRVEFKTDVLNERSRAALRRIGAIEEGVLRSHMITSSGRVRDTVYFSILVAEWPRVKEALEARLASAPSA
jgi:RimJ/RimL family protein N-acetyltransferase